MTGTRRELAIDAAALVIVKLVLGACVLRAGFTHISDDDYSRTVIAEQFAHAPRLDPSGTSWLPAPFWICGSAMQLFGRSLGVARALAVALGGASVAAPYLAMRTLGLSRIAALLATAFAMTMPWNLWLGVATVPEGWAGAIVAAALIAMPVRAAALWSAGGLLLGALSRYEAWPGCLVFSAVCLWRAARRRDHVGHSVACAVIAVAGPMGWMAWNAWSHGSPVHFVTRVATFRQSLGAAAVPLLDKLLGYPRALLTDMPLAALLGTAGALSTFARPGRQRWALPVVSAVVIVSFLVWGDVHDGAPTHHAARALVAVGWILVAWGVDSVVSLKGPTRATPGRPDAPEGKRAWGVGTLVMAVLAAGVALIGRPRAPGQTAYEDRRPQVARGLALRQHNPASVTVVPCSFEHFALLAAWGSPERAKVQNRTGAPPTAQCPLVSEP